MSRIDWRQIIFELMEAGLSGATIAERTGMAPSTLNGIKNCKWREPLYSRGAALIELHRRYKNAGLIGKQDKQLGTALADTSH